MKKLKELKKKLTALMLAMAMVISSPVVVAQTVVTAEAATVKLNQTSATLYENDSLQLKVEGTKKKVTWKTSDKAVATVNSKGLVTAVKAGKATITAKVGKKSYKCSIVVNARSLDRTDILLNVGNTYDLELTGVNSKDVYWSSGNLAVAYVYDGHVVAIGEGDTIVSATYGTHMYICYISVRNWFHADVDAIQIKVGEELEFSVIEDMSWTDVDYGFARWGGYSHGEKCFEVSSVGEWICLEEDTGRYMHKYVVKGTAVGTGFICYENECEAPFNGVCEYFYIPVVVTE